MTETEILDELRVIEDTRDALRIGEDHLETALDFLRASEPDAPQYAQQSWERFQSWKLANS